jgi:serine/threonine-protein kinase
MPEEPVAGRFEPLRLLGQGGMGTVHAALDRASGRLVALKRLEPPPGLSPAARAEAAERFVAEAARLRALQHPGIVALVDAGSDAGCCWLAMELLPGTDLTRYTRTGRLLPEALVLRIGERLAQALAHAHRAGIVHRDLKPSNVRVDWSTDRLKILDFGLARGADAQATRTGLLLGTPAYMAPELLSGRAPDARSDLYALGALLFQLLSGRLPFEATTLGELLRRVAQEPAPDLRSLSPAVAEPVARLVADLLAPQPELRPFDGNALAGRLQALHGGAPGGPLSR